MIHVVVEFQGVSRVVTGTKATVLELADNSTYQDIVRLLGQLYPKLIGSMIHADGNRFDASILDHSSQRMVAETDMNKCPRDGDRITLMSILAGG